jgi:hypothetical protein
MPKVPVGTGRVHFSRAMPRDSIVAKVSAKRKKKKIQGFPHVFYI